VAACEIADGVDNEAPYLIPLLNQASQVYTEFGIISADAAYLSRENCNAIAELGGTPRIYPKKNSTLKARGSRAWAEMMMAFIKDAQTWLEEFHQRSISESTNSVLKRRLPRPLLKVVDVRRKAEAFSRVLVYNIRQLNYAYYRWNIAVKWLTN